MSERYSRLYSLPENLYASGSPVIIAAGALLKDNQTGKVLAQLKLKNIAEKSIKAAKVSILPFDTVGNPLGAEIEYQYLDLSANRDEDFGAKSPIFLPNAATRRFSAAVAEVAFADNTVWKADGASWDTLPEFKNLISLLKDHEMVNQFQIKYGKACRYIPETHKDLWYCTCGKVNRQGEDKCHHCRHSLSALMAIDLNELREECNKRLAAEAKKAAEEKAAAEARAKKLKKTAAIVISIAVVVIAVGCLLKQVVIPTVKYNQAVTLLESGEYDEAVAAFEAMDGYKGSDSKVIETKYQKSVARMNAGDYDAAIAGFKELAELEEANAEADKSTEASTTYDTVEATSEEPYKPNQFIKKYGNLNQYGSYRDDVAECIYRMGMEAFDAGSYDKAIDAFEATDGYKDSAEQISNALALMDSAEKADSIFYRYKLKTAEVGDYVIFGTYEQDNDTSNGKEDIEWLVLDRQGDQLLVISKYALDCKPYNTEWTDVTWETCSIRQWLNNDFIHAAFSAEEQAMIPAVTVSADKNPTYSTNPGNATEDQVFLLSITEANQYFSSDSARQCEPTDYAFANGASKNGNGNCWWWLRSPGYYQNYAAVVYSSGIVDVFGGNVDHSLVGVRPALWIDLNA